ncbi:MAG: pseudouridine synthase [Bryobacteraceae bacterium]
MPEERLQKILSQAGVASRRKAEGLILEGRVSVNGETVTELGTKADITRDHIKVDHRLLHAPKRQIYIALNKPKNCMTTTFDPEGRETVMKFVRGLKERVYPVGRLDYHSEGLLLLTNDGEFANRMMSPAHHIFKTYVVKVNGELSSEQERQFREGVPLHGHRTKPAHLKLIRHSTNPWYEVRLTEGRQNQIRDMFKSFGRLVEKLKRVRIGMLNLDVKPGEFRHLAPQEVEKFRQLLKMTAEDAETPAEQHAEAQSEVRKAVSSRPANASRKPVRRPRPKTAGPSRSGDGPAPRSKPSPRAPAPKREAPKRRSVATRGKRGKGPR